MGLSESLIKLLSYLTITLLIILFAPGLPPFHVTFEAFPITPAMKLEGKLAPNRILDKSEILISNSQNLPGIQFIGPESVVIGPNEEIYMGVENGDILLHKNGHTSILSPAPNKCDPWEQFICGRPAGLRLFKGDLFVADTYHGIYKVDLKTGKREAIFDIYKPVEGKLALITDDLDITTNGDIFWSDASTTGDFMDAAHEFLGGPSGRLIHFDAKTKQNKVLISNIHFANGVQLANNQEFILVAETVRARILRYYLKGEKAGQRDVFIDGLPGLPDNIRSNENDGFFIALVSPRDLLEALHGWPSIRKLVSRVRQLLLWVLIPFETILPKNPYLGLARLRISHLGKVAHEQGQILEVDGSGNVLGYYGSQERHVSLISQMSLSKKYAYLASPFAEQLLRIKLSDLGR